MSNLDEALAKIGLKGLFIVWGGPNQGSRRSEQIAKKFNIPFEYVYLTTKKGLLYAPFKYAYQAFSTLLLLVHHRPHVIFIQNPPSIGPLFVYLYCLIFNAEFIIDSHTGALIYPQWRLTLPLQRFLSRRALTTILTNDYLAQEVASWGAHSFVLEDPPMEIEIPKPMNLKESTLNVAMICVADPDEPVAEVLEVARNLPEMDFYITGDFKKNSYFKHTIRSAPPNVHFTGFLHEDYFALLEAVDVVVCLTEDDHTFQSGANEALWVGKPLITSDWPILRRYFSRGTIHANNTAKGIRQALLEIQKNLHSYRVAIISLQERRRSQWYEKVQALLHLIQQHTSTTTTKVPRSQNRV